MSSGISHRCFPKFLAAVLGGSCWPLRLLGGSCVVISRVISPLIWVITILTLLITPLITTHEPPSRSSEETLSLNPVEHLSDYRRGSSSKRDCQHTHTDTHTHTHIYIYTHTHTHTYRQTVFSRVFGLDSGSTLTFGLVGIHIRRWHDKPSKCLGPLSAEPSVHTDVACLEVHG